MTMQACGGAAAKDGAGGGEMSRQGAGQEEMVKVLQGDCRAILPTLPERSVHCCITSPPYWGLRDYGTAAWEGGDPECDHLKVRDSARVGRSGLEGGKKTTGHQQEGFKQTCGHCGALRNDAQIGQEPTLAGYIATMVEVFAQVHRVLRDDGVCFLNLGDSYAGSWGNYAPGGIKGVQRARSLEGERWERPAYDDTTVKPATANGSGLPAKNLCMVPHRVAIALQEWGWIVRQDNVWSKTAPMPESVQDRTTRSHEYVFQLVKQERYFYDAVAVAEPCVKGAAGSTFTSGKTGINGMGRVGQGDREESGTRNLRSVWHLNPQPFAGSHFAVMPEELVRRCLLAGTSDRGCCPACLAPYRRVVERGPLVGQRENPGQPAHITPQGYLRAGKSRCGVNSYLADTGWLPTCTCDAGDPVPCTVLDPFFGAGTTGVVAKKNYRRCIGIELSYDYARLAEDRIDAKPVPLFSAAI